MSIYTKNSTWANITPSASTLSVFGGSSTSTDYTWNNVGITAIQSTLKVSGDADFDGDIRIKGQSISETINKINERLNILVPNEKLEKNWSELAELRMRYVELERELLEKQRVFDILKKSG